MEIAIWIGVFLLVLISVLLMMLCSRMTYINEALDRAPQIHSIISHQTRDHQELLIETMAITQDRIADINETLLDRQYKENIEGAVKGALDEIETKLIYMPTSKDIEGAVKGALDEIETKLIYMPTSKDIELAVSLALGDIRMKLIDMPTREDIELAVSSALRPPQSHHEDFT